MTDKQDADQYEIVHVQDKWAELLPQRIPLRYAFFRYLGFCIKKKGVPGNTSAKALKPASRAALRIKITTSKGVVLDEKIASHFKDGVYYVQDVKLHEEGMHSFSVWIESRTYTSVKPFEHELHVHQFMRLHDDPASLFSGPYGSLRQAVDPHMYGDLDEEINVDWTDELIDECLANSKTKLRAMDARWWLRQFIEQGELQAKKQRALKRAPDEESSKKSVRPRKQAHPIRSGDKRDHDNYFQRRQKDIKRQRMGQIRIFGHEPLYANKTHTVFSKRVFFRQLAQYAQK